MSDAAISHIAMQYMPQYRYPNLLNLCDLLTLRIVLHAQVPVLSLF